MRRRVPKSLLGYDIGSRGKENRLRRLLQIIQDKYLTLIVSFPLIVEKLRSPISYALAFVIGFRNPELRTLEFRDGMRITLRGAYSDYRVVLENAIWDIYGWDHPFDKNRALTIIDIGAHIGTFAVVMGKRYPNATIYAFEPFIENFKLLTKNIQDSKITNVRAQMKAIAGKRGEVNLNISSSNTGAHSIIFQQDGLTSVEAIPLSDVFATYNISTCDFLKVDCEGAEYDILLSTPGDVLNKIQTIVMEYHNSDKHNQSEIVTYLKGHGFKIEYFGESVTEPLTIGVLRAEKKSA